MRSSLAVILASVVVPTVASCSLLLDTDALQKGTGQSAVPDAGYDASAGSGGTAGTGGSGGTAGTGGSAGASGSGATGGQAGVGGDAGPAEIPLDELGGRLAEASCAALQACLGPFAEFVHHDDDCVEYMTAAFEDTTVEAIRRSVAAGPITYDPAAAAECVRILSEGAAQDPPVCIDLQKGLDDCKAALGQLGAAGDDCRHYYECGVGLYCDIDTCPGTCVAMAQQGAACAKSTECAVGLTCFDPLLGGTDGGILDGGLKSGTCEPYTPTNGSCGLDNPACETGDYCTNSKCLPLAEAFVGNAGFPCYMNGTFCKPGLSCEFNTLPFLSNAECAQPHAATEPCKVGLPSSCKKGLYCSYGDGVNPKCVALPTENQACAKATAQAFAISPPCAAGLACVDDLCRTRSRLGEACLADAQCLTGTCSSSGDAGGSVCTLPECL